MRVQTDVAKYLTMRPEMKTVDEEVDIHADNELAFRWACWTGHLDVVKFLTISSELKRLAMHG